MADATPILRLHGLESFPDRAAILESAFAAVAADEGTLWLLDEPQEALVPVWNSGPNAETFVGKHHQPLSAGLISLVCVSEQAQCENEVYRNVQQDPTLDMRLGVLTCAMIAAPLRIGGTIRGVVSCVRLKNGADAPDPAPFGPLDLTRVMEAVEKLGAALERA